MLLLLLIIPFALLWELVAAHREALSFQRLSIRGAFVVAYLIFQLLLLAITELTSMGHNFDKASVAISWLVVTIILLAISAPRLIRVTSQYAHRNAFRNILSQMQRRLNQEEWIWVIIIAAILAVLVVVGSMYVPSNGDSMIYHLSRVEHWVQNRSIAPFATVSVGQVDFSPLSEYNLAHLHLLTGIDRFDWSMQWFAAVVSIIGASELARLLGAPKFAQLAAAVICATLPSGILLATSTENDYFTAAMGMGLFVVLFSMSFGRRWATSALFLGLTVGLAYMAKGTVPLMLGPAIVVVAVVVLHRQGLIPLVQGALRRIVAIGGIVLAGAAVVVGPFLFRTWQVFGSPTGVEGSRTLNANFTMASFGSNVVRSLAGNFEIGNGVSGVQTYVSMVVLGALRHVYPIFGTPFGDRDYAIFLFPVDPFRVANYTVQQRSGDYGANPWLVVLAVVAFVVFGIGVARGSKSKRVPLLFAIGLSVGYILISGVARWSLLEVRYSMPLFVLWAAVIGVAVAEWRRWVVRLVLIGLTLSCLPQLLENVDRPLVPPANFGNSYLSGYFPTGVPTAETTNGSKVVNPLAQQYETITTVLAQSECKRAGIGNLIFVEYPLWVGLQHWHWNGTLNDFDIHNATAKLGTGPPPSAMLTTQSPGYETPENDTANVQIGGLALSLKAKDASTVRTRIPGFESHVDGVHILPGGGWRLAEDKGQVLHVEDGSLYVFSAAPRDVELQLHRPSGPALASVTFTDPGGVAVPGTSTGPMIVGRVELRKGLNRIGLKVAEGTSADEQGLAVNQVTVAPVGA